MFYAVKPVSPVSPEDDLIFEDIEHAQAALKKHKGARMKAFENRSSAENFIQGDDLITSMEQLSISKKGDESSSSSTFPEAKPALLNTLRRAIEKGEYDEVSEIVWSNPRCLVTVCDSAVYLMAGPKYNACHIAARANKSEIMFLLLETISNTTFLKKIYPDESDTNIQDRLTHLVDSYLNTPDPRQGNTPLHFACKLGHLRVAKVLLTYEGCDLNLRNREGKTAQECTNLEPEEIKKLFNQHLSSPFRRDQLKKKLVFERRRSRTDDSLDESFQ